RPHVSRKQAKLAVRSGTVARISAPGRQLCLTRVAGALRGLLPPDRVSGPVGSAPASRRRRKLRFRARGDGRLPVVSGLESISSQRRSVYRDRPAALARGDAANIRAGGTPTHVGIGAVRVSR